MIMDSSKFNDKRPDSRNKFDTPKLPENPYHPVAVKRVVFGPFSSRSVVDDNECRSYLRSLNDGFCFATVRIRLSSDPPLFSLLKEELDAGWIGDITPFVER
jgi:hypothetical protein